MHLIHTADSWIKKNNKNKKQKQKKVKNKYGSVTSAFVLFEI